MADGGGRGRGRPRRSKQRRPSNWVDGSDIIVTRSLAMDVSSKQVSSSSSSSRPSPPHWLAGPPDDTSRPATQRQRQGSNNRPRHPGQKSHGQSGDSCYLWSVTQQASWRVKMNARRVIGSCPASSGSVGGRHQSLRTTDMLDVMATTSRVHFFVPLSTPRRGHGCRLARKALVSGHLCLAACQCDALYIATLRCRDRGATLGSGQTRNSAGRGRATQYGYGVSRGLRP